MLSIFIFTFMGSIFFYVLLYATYPIDSVAKKLKWITFQTPVFIRYSRDIDHSGLFPYIGNGAKNDPLRDKRVSLAAIIYQVFIFLEILAFLVFIFINAFVLKNALDVYIFIASGAMIFVTPLWHGLMCLFDFIIKQK